MNLWIESQDKEYLGIFKKFQQCHAEIHGYDETWEDDAKVVLGEYASSQRAKEVMAEIKKRDNVSGYGRWNKFISKQCI